MLFGTLVAIAILFALAYLGFAIAMEVIYARQMRHLEKDVQYQLTRVELHPRRAVR